MPVRLRPHHLLCVQRYRGEGYSDEFVENLTEVVDRVERGEPVEVVREEDDVCAACDEECAEGRVELRDAAVLSLLEEESFAAAEALPEERRTVACAGCEWYALCY